jgi:hypothetical protein
MTASVLPRPFRIILHSKPAVSLPDNLQQLVLNFPELHDSIVAIAQLSETAQGQKIPIGLEFRVKLDAASLQDAVQNSMSLADGVASFITIVTGVGIPIPKPMICYEISETSKEHDFMQIFDNIGFNDPSRKRLSPDKLLEKITAFYKLSEAPVSDRIARAIRWYRLGTGTTDVFERFNAYWIGLEALNPLLQTRLGVDDDKTTCPKCGHEWAPIPTVSGIRAFCAQEIDDGKKVYRRIHDLRISLMHSKEKLASLGFEASSLAPIIGNVLLAAVEFLLGAPKPWISHSEVLTNATPFRLEVDGKLIAEKLEDLFPDPHFEATHSVAKVDRTPDGKTTVTVTSTFTPVFGTSTRISVTGIGMFGEGKGELRVQSIS